MKNLSFPDFDPFRTLIKRMFERDGMTWEKVKFLNRDVYDKKHIEDFLRRKNEDDFLPLLTEEEWFRLVDLQRENEEKLKRAAESSGQSIIYDGEDLNKIIEPESSHSAWNLYKKKLVNEGFSEQTIFNITNSTVKILKTLSIDTRTTGPVKGLVIGNVQSGKTANMAGLMAMAADYGWNLFIILSGTIENLRVQTQKRLLNDLSSPGNLTWMGIELNNKTITQQLSFLDLRESSNTRYFTVCLKNKKRLENLISWLSDDNNKENLKILVIDDESDQASINTAKIQSSEEEQERKAINRLIYNLVFEKSKTGRDNKTKYRSMNYIGYTATPYANILNEASEKSLYPSKFIATLPQSSEYFGPQQIFGSRMYNYDGMDILREIPVEDVNTIKEIHEGKEVEIPLSLQDAVIWFVCAVATLRTWGIRKPASMLIHTSQKTEHHDLIASAVKKWVHEFTSNPDHMERAEEIWDFERLRFTKETFFQQFADYGVDPSSVKEYPYFSSIRDEIRNLLDNMSHITLGDRDEGKFEYGEGIHLCIDNCTRNGVNDEGEYLRLVYPEKENMPDKSPAFLVIGGATLSRGLTIEGLVSTYFLRDNVLQADTLMQMGRFFGYRRGYELLPRIWITRETWEKFEFLSELDEELRKEIQDMETTSRKPIEYAVKIKTSPKLNSLRITAKNKMQKAVDANIDFTGSFNQTYLFYKDKMIQEKNRDIIESFISGLDKPGKSPRDKNYLWKNVDFPRIKNLLETYRFVETQAAFNPTLLKNYIIWLERMHEEGKLSDWNVILANKDTGNRRIWKQNGIEIGMVTRTKKKNYKNNDVINIGVLSDPSVQISDIEISEDSQIEKLLSLRKKENNWIVRNMAGLGKTPQLALYIIDKDSKINSRSGNSAREDLDSEVDLYGMSIFIPGENDEGTSSKWVKVDLSDFYKDKGDIED